jgi:hypothetical protein
VPSVVNVHKIIDGLNFIMRPLYEVIAQQVRDGVREQREREPQRAAALGSAA